MRAADFKQLKVHVAMLKPSSLAFVVVAAAALELNARVAAEPSGSTQAPRPAVVAKICPAGTPGVREKYRLPPPARLPDGISFATDWERLASGGWFGQQIMDRCRMQPDGARTWHGKTAVRVEVQPNDDPLNLNANSERAEMLTMQTSNGADIKEGAKSGVQYYATSYYFPATWQGQQLPWSAFPQQSCSAGNQNQCNSWSYVWQFYGWGALGAAQTALAGPQHYTFNGSRLRDGGAVALGKWTDFVFAVDWGTGAYTVWRRDEGEVSFKEALRATTPVPAGQGIYVKQGLYRGGNVNGRTDVLWIGPTVRGSSFSAVKDAAF